MRIDRERGCCRITFESMMGLSALRKRIDACAEQIEGLLGSAEILREGESYVISVRHRESLKDYLEHQIFDLYHFILLLRRLRGMLEALRAAQLPVYDCLWDVDCVFVGNHIHDLSVVYIPDLCADATSEIKKVQFRFSDMLAVISLRVYESEIPALQALSQVVSSFSAWEDSTLLHNHYSATPFVEAEERLLPFCQESNRLLRGFHKVVEALKSPRNTDGGAQDLQEQSGDSGMGLFHQPNSVSHVYGRPKHPRLCLEGMGILKGRRIDMDVRLDVDDTGFLLFGREAEVEQFYLPYPVISRRHASVSYRDGQWILTDLKSANGTFLNGSRIEAGREYPLRRGNCIYLAHAEIAFRVKR